MVIAPMRVCNMVVCYIECIAVREDLKKQNLGRQAVCQVREYLRTFKGTGTKLEGMYVILGMSRVTKPHIFFRKLGFTPGLPSEFMCWADDKLDMAYDFLQPFDELDALVANCNDISADSNA